jgi:hypothetical protein
MNDRPDSRQAMPDAGLCDRCRYGNVITSDRGSRFMFCGKSKTDPRYPRYPRLPVRECDGFEEVSYDS